MLITRYELQDCLEQAIISDCTKFLFSSEWHFADDSHPGLVFKIFYVPGGYKHLCYQNSLHITISYQLKSDDEAVITAYYDNFDRPVIQMYRGRVLYYMNRLRILNGAFAGCLTNAYEFTLFESLFKLIQDKMKIKGHMISLDAEFIMVNEMIDEEERVKKGD